jgi:hypothetical protein
MVVVAKGQTPSECTRGGPTPPCGINGSYCFKNPVDTVVSAQILPTLATAASQIYRW